MKTKPKLTNRELSQCLHDAMCHELLDEMGAPVREHGHRLSIFGRLRRIAKIWAKVRAKTNARIAAIKAT